MRKLCYCSLLPLLIGALFAQPPKAPLPKDTPPGAGAAPGNGPEKKDQPSGAPATAAPASTTPSLLKITINPSRKPIVLDTPASVEAILQNVSSKPLTLYEGQTKFHITPEIREGAEEDGACATFPTLGNDGTPRPPEGYKLVLPPGRSYLVYWNLGTDGCKRGAPLTTPAKPWFTNPFPSPGDTQFSPGNYTVSLVVHTYEGDSKDYQPAVEGQAVDFAAPLRAILWGAFVGGILAYSIKTYYGTDSGLPAAPIAGKKTRVFFEGVMAGVFGMAITTLASRLPDSFPVTVSAKDFLGSIALGFVFQWTGVSVLAKLPSVKQAKTGQPAPEADPKLVPDLKKDG
jgi:hypothetical protein